MSLNRQDLIGTYRLVYGGMERADGTIGYPFGPDAVAYLTYLENGYASWHMMAANRPPFVRYGLHGGTPEENDRAFRTGLSYWARYSIEGDDIWYDIEICPIPNLVGRRTNHSRAELRGDKLHLTSQPFLVDGRECRTKFIWQRL